MFWNLFKQKNTTEKIAYDLYQAAMAQSRKPVFYERYAVPDHFDGRFDLLLLHLFLIMEPLTQSKADDLQKLNQTLFDVTFRNMDQTLREMGIGDMGVPKHMKRMMTAFNGRMNSYHASLYPQDALEDVDILSLEACLLKNVYGVLEGDASDEQKKGAALLATYVRSNLEALEESAAHVSQTGDVRFVHP